MSEAKHEEITDWPQAPDGFIAGPEGEFFKLLPYETTLTIVRADVEKPVEVCRMDVQVPKGWTTEEINEYAGTLNISRVPPVDPHESEIVQWRDGRWITNGEVLIDIDALILPDLHRSLNLPESFAHLLDGIAEQNYCCPLRFVSIVPKEDGYGRQKAAYHYDVNDGARKVKVWDVYGAMVQGCDLTQGAGPIDPIQCVRDGRVVAYIMPLRQ